MHILRHKIDFKQVEIDCIAFTILLYLFRATLPVLKFPFLLFLIGLSIYSIIKYGRTILPVFKGFIRRFYLPVLLLIILITSFVLSNKLYLVVFKDIINGFILIILFFLMTVLIKSKTELNHFYTSFNRLIVFFAILISVSLLINFLKLSFTDHDQLSNNAELIPFLGMVSSDYNFALIPVFFGMITVLYYLIEPGSSLKRYIFNLILLFLSLPVILASSRRGILTFTGLIVFLIVIQLIHHSLNNNAIRKIAINSRPFLISILITTLLLTGFVFIIPVNLQKKTLTTLGINIDSYRQFASPLLFKYSTIFSDKEYAHYRRVVLREKQDPLNPDSGWGKKVSTRAFPLTGENVGIIPENSIGYRMDSTCDASSWNNNAYSYTEISGLLKEERSAKDNEWYFASVYCFVSNDFDGTWAYIFTENATSGVNVQSYDFKKRGIWQKLSIYFKSKGDIPLVYLYWAKAGATDFSKIKGNIIFAYPQFKFIRAENKDPVLWGTRISSKVYPLSGENVAIVPEGSIGYKMDNTCDPSTWGNSAYSFTNISVLFQGDTINSIHKTYQASVYCFVSHDFDGSWANLSAEGKVSGNVIAQYDLTKKGTWQKLQISFSSVSAIPPVYLYWAKGGVPDFKNLKGFVIFAYPQYSILNADESSYLLHDMHQSGTAPGIINKNLISACLFESAFPPVNILLSSGIDHDLIRKWADILISEDTTYHFPRSNLEVNNISNRFIGNRLMRWQFAGKIFINEYNWKQKIFGGGFGFLNWYGLYFLKNRTASDYPHNPLLSVLLYSGIAGLVLYLFFLYSLVSCYLKYFREYTLLSLFFLITFIFSFFSAGSPFDPPIMGFFVLLPFFLDHIHKKTEVQ
jgi:hypothetical protein